MDPSSILSQLWREISAERFNSMTHAHVNFPKKIQWKRGNVLFSTFAPREGKFIFPGKWKKIQEIGISLKKRFIYRASCFGYIPYVRIRESEVSKHRAKKVLQPPPRLYIAGSPIYPPPLAVDTNLFFFFHNPSFPTLPRFFFENTLHAAHSTPFTA